MDDYNMNNGNNNVSGNGTSYDYSASSNGTTYEVSSIPQENINNNSNNNSKSSNGLAVAGLVFGILSLIPCCYVGLGIFISIIAILLSIVGRKNENGTGWNGTAIGGLVCGIIGLIISLLVTMLLFTGIVQFSNAISTIDDSNSSLESILNQIEEYQTDIDV